MSYCTPRFILILTDFMLRNQSRESESEILERSESNVESESEILPLTLQPWVKLKA